MLSTTDERQLLFTRTATALLTGRTQNLDGELIPSSNSTAVARVVFDEQAYFVKVFKYRSLGDSLKQKLRGSRAERSAEAAQLLTRHGFHTPEVVACHTSLLYSWLATRAVPGEPLGRYLETHWQGRLQGRVLREKHHLIRALGHCVGHLHQCGIIHGDLRLNNILLVTSQDEPVFYLIDNERNHHYRRVPPMGLLIKNLVQLNLMYPPLGTRTDRLRFWKSYCSAFPRLSQVRQVAIRRRVIAKTRERMERLAGKVEGWGTGNGRRKT